MFSRFRLGYLAVLLILPVLGCQTADRSATTTTTERAQTNGAGSTATAEEDKVVEAARSLVPAVVNIQTAGAQGEGQGSGVIFRKDGHILTNAHVIAGAQRVTVLLASGAQESATVVGADSFTDIAVLRIDRDNLPVAPLGSSRGLKVGEFVLAVGSPLGFRHSVTFGIVSALDRAIPEGGPALVDLVQTDAPISPGNSGGALASDDGKVIGINVAAIQPSAGAQGLGFAVPIDTARETADELIREGRVVHAFLGVETVTLTEDLASQFNLASSTGALIVDVQPDSPADGAGLRAGDILVEMGGQKIEGTEDVFGELRRRDPGDRVELEVFRDSRRVQLQAVLGERE